MQQALEHPLPLRGEGLRILKHEQRGVLLNAIAGCYPAQGRSEEAFAYLYEAPRGAGPARGHGFDAVLHCNLSHELLQLGDHDEALAQVDRGLARCQDMRNARLESMLRINRVIGLSETGRAAEALPDVQRLCELPATPSGRGVTALHFETLAIAVLRAGQAAQGAELLARAHASAAHMPPDERVELAVATALLARLQGRPAAALAALAAVRCWQVIDAQRARLASQAGYQAAALQSELLTLQHQLEENAVRRRATERARAELALANQALSRTIDEVQALQAALREQATQDVLTGLFNRRHLNDTPPPMLARALREQQPLAVAVIDLDHFKLVNDTHGHPAGDLLLTAFGRLLREQLRGSDLAFRYGGEEFCVLLPNTTGDAARAKLLQLLAWWRGQCFELDMGLLQGQSFSAGLADTASASPSPVQLLRAADDLPLCAKREGRGRLRVHGPARPAPAL